MFNHIRTLLLNGYQNPNEKGEEAVPRDFIPRRLDGVATLARTCLMAEPRNRQDENYRLAQLMPLVHASLAGPFAVEADARLTYASRGEELNVDWDDAPAGGLEKAIEACGGLTESKLRAVFSPGRLRDIWDKHHDQVERLCALAVAAALYIERLPESAT